MRGEKNNNLNWFEEKFTTLKPSLCHFILIIYLLEARTTSEK